MGRVEGGADLWEWMEAFGRREGVRAGWIQAIGAVRRAAVAWYDQEKREYLERKLDGPLEIVSCTGNFSLKDGDPFPHIHIVLAGKDGSCVGGHLLPGCEVFLVEYQVRELKGPEMVRTPDEALGLPVWSLET